MTETLACGYSSESTLKSECYAMNTKMTGFTCFLKTLCSCALDESSLSIGRVKYCKNLNGTCTWYSSLNFPRCYSRFSVTSTVISAACTQEWRRTLAESAPRSTMKCASRKSANVRMPLQQTSCIER